MANMTFIEVIDQYGARHRYPSGDHFVERFDGYIQITRESDAELETIATFPNPAAWGKCGALECLSLRESPPGIVRKVKSLEQLIDDIDKAARLNMSAWGIHIKDMIAKYRERMT